MLLRGALAGVVAGVLAAAALLAGLSWLQGEAGRAWLLAQLNRQLDAPSGTRLRIGRLEGDLWHGVEIRDLVALDDDGEWLHLRRARAEWSLAALLLRRLQVADLELEGLSLARAPAGAEPAEDSGWPEIPLAIAIGHLALRDAVLEAPLLGERIAFGADGSLDLGGGRGLRARLAAQRTGGASGELRLDADLRPRSDRYGLDLSLEEAPGGVVARLLELEGLPAVSLQVSVGGPARDLAGRLRARLGELARVDGTLELDARGDPAVALAGHAEVAGLLPPSLREALSGEIAFEGQVAQTADGIALRDVRLERGATRLALSGELRDFAVEGDATLSLADLAPLGDWLALPLRGAGDLRAQLRSDDFRRAVTADVSATWRDPVSADAPLRALVGSRVELSGRLAFEAGRHLTLDGVEVATQGMTLAGDGRLELERASLAAELRVELPDAAVLDPLVGTPLAGSLHASGTLSGDAADPALVATLGGQELSVDGVALGPAEATLDLAHLATGVGGRVALSLEPAALGPLSLETGLALEGADQLRLAPIALHARETTLAGALRVDLARGTATGRIAASDVVLADWSEPAGRALAGRAQLSLALEGGARQALRVEAEARALVLALETGALTADSVRLDARVADAWGTARPTLEASATTVGLAGVELDGLELALAPVGERGLHGRLRAWGEGRRGALRLELEGDYAEDDAGSLLTLAALDAGIGDHGLRLSRATSIAWRNQTTTLAPTRLALDGGSLSAQGRLGASQLEGSLEVDELPLALLDLALPASAPKGSLSGRLTLAGTRAAPTGELHLESSGQGVVTGVGGAQASVPVRLDGSWRDARCELRLVLREPGGRDVDGAVSLPLRLDPETLALSLPPQEPVAGRLRWEGDPGPLWDLLSPYEDRLSGLGHIEVALAGSVAAPRASGRLELARGRYENLGTGTALTDVQLRLVGDGERLVLEELAAGDGVQGKLSGRGAVLLLPAQHYPIDVSVELDDMLLVARDELTLRASGKLALEGTLAQLVLRGKVETGRSELSLSHSLPPSVVELDVDELRSGVPLVAESQRTRRAPSILSLDVGVAVPGRAFARGLGLDSEWSGELQVGGRADAPRLSGVLSPVRGHFTLMGKRFSLERGAIRFTGSEQIDPRLDLSAEHRASGVTAIVRVTGTASKPEVKLTSRPPMPEADVASQVLFGTGSANLTPSQSLQLATAIATYSGVGGPVGILDTTRRTLGIDVIGFKESEENPDATRVSVGKYITDGVYVEFEAGGEETSHAATTVEVEVLPDVRVEGGTTEKGGTKVGVKWKWDY